MNSFRRTINFELKVLAKRNNNPHLTDCEMRKIFHVILVWVSWFSFDSFYYFNMKNIRLFTSTTKLQTVSLFAIRFYSFHSSKINNFGDLKWIWINKAKQISRLVYSSLTLYTFPDKHFRLYIFLFSLFSLFIYKTKSVKVKFL